MEEKNNGKGIVIAILSVLLVISILYIGYDKLFKKETSTVDNSMTSSNVTNDTKSNSNTEKNDESQANVDTTGKIYVKRNGIINLETVPSNLVGTYATQCGSYFTINSDGTIYAIEGTGDGGKDIYDKSNTTFQITYIPNSEKMDKDILLEIYTTTSNGWIFSPFRIGHKDNNGNYSFASLENTPCVNAYEFSYIKK